MKNRTLPLFLVVIVLATPGASAHESVQETSTHLKPYGRHQKVEMGNVALGKLVVAGVKEQAGYLRPASRLTDGDLATDAYSGAFTMDYKINLMTYSEGHVVEGVHGFNLQHVVLHWGHYGRHFPGIRQANGQWARAAYKADYVNRYQLEYKRFGEDKWFDLHRFDGRPTDENKKGIRVARDPIYASINEGKVTTCIKVSDLKNVTAIRIKAHGGHCIGLYELEVYGIPSPR